MNAKSARISHDANLVARERLLSARGEPLFLANWDRVLFIHFEVDTTSLQQETPFELDLFNGRAYVTLVAFTMRRMRVCFGGRLGAWLCRPFATQHFLNVRTYVRHHNEPGILFLAEWLSNSLCVWLGPRTYGLPYRSARIAYNHRHEAGRLDGVIAVPGIDERFEYEGLIETNGVFASCSNGSLDEFLLERYTAFTFRKGTPRRFRIWHRPWLQTTANVAIKDSSVLVRTWSWFQRAQMIGANYSPGAENVWMGWPRRIRF